MAGGDDSCRSHGCRGSDYLVVVAVVMAIEMVVLGVTIMVTVTAVITWNLQIDWGHLLNRQRDCSPSDI